MQNCEKNDKKLLGSAFSKLNRQVEEEENRKVRAVRKLKVVVEYLVRSELLPVLTGLPR